jgi:ATP-binding cassette subfamily B protein RaxB
MKTILQTEASECALACLAMVAGNFGYHTTLHDLRKTCSISLKGMTLTSLVRQAAAMRLSARPLRLELDELAQLPCPCILHWNLNHFVVLRRVRRTWRGALELCIIDPAIGELRMSLADASPHFTGVAVELTPTPAFEKRAPPPDIPISYLTGKVKGLRLALVQVISIALVLELLAIASPLFNQFIIDEVIVSGDTDLLKVLVLGFGLMLVTQTSIGLARSWFLMRWSIDVGTQWASRLFTHLIGLPASYFEKRHLGDIVSRFGSIGAIQGTLTSLFVESLLDGLLALCALCMMLMYSVQLSAVVLAGIVLYAALRWAAYGPFREAAHERLILAAKESSSFLETIRAIVPLKLFNREAERNVQWQNARQDVINRDVQTQKLGIMFKSASTAISGLQGMTVFYLGATQVIDNLLSIGMLMAFSSYSSTFSGRIFGLIDLGINVKMLSLHTERLADIVLEEAEPDDDFDTDVSELSPSITLRNVRFRYADGEPWVLDGINLHIKAGQSVALIGASGCGKTTLCKLLLGLLPVTEGEILIDSMPISRMGVRSLRRLVGTVMQDDVLLAGSILDNISFFDSHAQPDVVKECARLAAIHDELVTMPMGYQTLVGDMGSSLSGGQKQRILLARALYKRPKILCLDEATSHLDVDNELRVNTALANLHLTRVIVAHRPETIRSAQRVVTLRDGKIVDIGAALTPAA